MGAGRPPPSRRPGGSGGTGQVQVRGAARLFDLAVPPSDSIGQAPSAAPAPAAPGSPLPQPGLTVPPTSPNPHPTPSSLPTPGAALTEGKPPPPPPPSPGPSQPPLPPHTCGNSAPAREDPAPHCSLSVIPSPHPGKDLSSTPLRKGGGRTPINVRPPTGNSQRKKKKKASRSGGERRRKRRGKEGLNPPDPPSPGF